MHYLIAATLIVNFGILWWRQDIRIATINTAVFAVIYGAAAISLPSFQ